MSRAFYWLHLGGGELRELEGFEGHGPTRALRDVELHDAGGGDRVGADSDAQAVNNGTPLFELAANAAISASRLDIHKLTLSLVFPRLDPPPKGESRMSCVSTET
jgi:hypothetical protein